METINLYAPHLSDPDKAREYLEKIRWPEGVECPHCATIGNHYQITGRGTSTKPARKGLWKCHKCRKQFSVTVGTIFERSHVPLNKWLAAIYLLCSSKKGMSAHQLHRMLGITYKSAWFMAHRIRHAITDFSTLKLTGIVEADETYVGGKARGSGLVGRTTKKKTPVFSLVERGGNVKSQMVERVTGANLKAIIRGKVDKSAIMMTDDYRSYMGLRKEFADHKIIKHSHKKYVDGDIHTNTIEGYFSILKRGIVGIYHHVGKQHLHRYLNEFDFRYNHRKKLDSENAVTAMVASKGKRLMYRESLKHTN
ncbi:MAG: IS1595 family transposase [Nitrospirota bacterium]